jgi:hypothetical protein
VSGKPAYQVASIQAMPVRGLSREAAARYIGVSPASFDAMVTEKLMPGPRAWHRRRLWDIRELDIAFDALPKDGEAVSTGWEDFKGWPP